MKLLALVLLISAFSSPILTEVLVVNDFVKSKCSESFIKTKKEIITPTVFTGNDYKRICQYWNGVYRYATFYDTKNRIPVFSAYTLVGDIPTERNEKWKNEPQLESSSAAADMELILDAEMDKYSHQAVNRDYVESMSNTNPSIAYTRGHVFPNQYASNQDQADSTFTFTNIAPQTLHSNNQWAEQVETPMRKEILKSCKPNNNNPAYIVTGVVPGTRWISIRRDRNNGGKIDYGVNIPSYYWTAYCCVHDSVRHSRGFLSLQNKPDDKTYELSQMSVNMLNERLSALYGKEFKVFGDLCLIRSELF